VDAELRTLERAALSGGARERLAWARGLERAGRRDEAVAALVPVRDDHAVRAHLEALPAWTHLDGNPGATDFLDARPVARTPHVRWTVDVSAETQFLLASPLVLVTLDEDGHLVAIDPGTGAMRHIPTPPLRFECLELRLASLIHDDDETGVLVVDLVTGTTRAVPDPGRAAVHTSARDRDFMVRVLTSDLVEAFSTEPNGAVREKLWRFPASGHLDEDLAGCADVKIGPNSVVLLGAAHFAVLDRATGALVFRGEGGDVGVDALGVLHLNPPSLSVHDAVGKRVWSRTLDDGGVELALSPDVLVIANGGATCILDRRTGWPVGVVREYRHVHAVIGDVVYTSAAGSLEARRLSAEVLWSFDAGGIIDAFAALDARIFLGVRSPDGESRRILCLEEPRPEEPLRTAR